MIEILPPALGLDVFRAGALQTDPSCDGYALVMLRAASLRWPRRRRLARSSLTFGLLGPVAPPTFRVSIRLSGPDARTYDPRDLRITMPDGTVLTGDALCVEVSGHA